MKYIYIYIYIYINTHTCMYIFKKICYDYILNIFRYYINDMNINIYMQIQVNIFKIYAVCVYIIYT